MKEKKATQRAAFDAPMLLSVQVKKSSLCLTVWKRFLFLLR